MQSANWGRGRQWKTTGLRDLYGVLARAASILGIRALIQGPTRFAGKVVPIRMDRLAAAVWLSVFPLTIAIVFTRLFYSPPRTHSEANYLANEWGPFVLRALSVTCLFTGGAIALLTATPEVKPKVTGKRRARTKKRKR